ncbi:hypothetical protein PsYK624_155690 [Phanerochaete sordida]|uniref:Uncharacterized protein n=1 Tax=Phanerochaete sordida TaxID=48140 RepID=A0A9P3GTA7_9APHY|nr:hypothetical protein PsYK624_155690 [Phanerochaete sordida]
MPHRRTRPRISSSWIHTSGSSRSIRPCESRRRSRLEIAVLELASGSDSDVSLVHALSRRADATIQSLSGAPQRYRRRHYRHAPRHCLPDGYNTGCCYGAHRARTPSNPVQRR